jgi:hypothetical protein
MTVPGATARKIADPKMARAGFKGAVLRTDPVGHSGAAAAFIALPGKARCHELITIRKRLRLRQQDDVP